MKFKLLKFNVILKRIYLNPGDIQAFDILSLDEKVRYGVLIQQYDERFNKRIGHWVFPIKNWIASNTITVVAGRTRKAVLTKFMSER